MRRFMAVSLTVAMLIAVASPLVMAKSVKTELFAFDETMQVFDKDGEAEKINIPSGSKIGFEESLVTWGRNSNDEDKVDASVVSDENGANGDAFKLHYTDKVAADYGETLRLDSISVDYSDISETKPLVLEFTMKTDWDNVADMKACVDVVPVIKSEIGNTIENNPLTQQSIQPATDNGQWLNVKYVIKQITVNDDKASLLFDRYVNTEKKLTDSSAAMAAGTGDGAKLIGFKIRPRARTTSYNEGGYMNITFDSIKIYREETVIPTGTKWGEDLTIDGENKPGDVAHGTTIGDSDTAAQYKLVNQDGTVEGYSAQITEDNSSLIVNNVASSDGYKTTLTPVLPKKYTTDDVSENGAMVYEARYKLDYERNEEGNTSYSAVQMFFDFYRADNKTMQFAVPANTKESGEYVTVKIIIPKGTFDKKSQPCMLINDTVKMMNVTIDDLEYITLRRVVLSNKARSGQTPEDENTAITLTLDYLDQYIIAEEDEFEINSDKLEDEITLDTEGVNFTGTHYIDETTLKDVVLKKKAADGSYAALEEGTYGVKATGSKTFYMGFGESLVSDSEYEIDLSAVKDIYGNSTDKKIYFSIKGTPIEEGDIQWLDCIVSGDTVSYKLENGTSRNAEGRVYAATVDKQSGTLKICIAESVTVPQNDMAEGTITISDFDRENDEVVLFFWDKNNMPYTDKKTVSAE